MSSETVIVIGGGVIGLACARVLAARGTDVTLCDPGPLPGSASPASAGMLAAQIEAHADDPLLAITIHAREVAERLAGELQDATGIDVRLPQEGIARLAFSDDEASDLRGAVARHRQLGLRADWLSPEELRARQPGIAPDILGAFIAFEDASIDPNGLLQALTAHCASLGVKRKTERVTALEIANGVTTGVRTAGGTLSGDVILLAAGAWSPSISGLPRPLPIKPMRGQMSAFPWPKGEPPAVLYCGDGYVMHRLGEAVAGSTMEAAGFEVSTTPEGLEHVAKVAEAIFPSLAGATPLRSWCGLRPITPDGIPILGPDPELGRLWYATGHGRNGILMAGMTGEVMADLILGAEPETDLTACQPDRFFGNP